MSFDPQAPGGPTPGGYSPLGELPPQVRPESGSGTGKWIIVLMLVLCFLLLACIGTCFFTVRIVDNWIQGPLMEMVDEMVEMQRELFEELITMDAPIGGLITALNENEEVTDRLGTPITPVRFDEQVQFSANVSDDKADLRIAVRGPDGRARVEGSMIEFDGDWVPERIEVTFDDGESIILESDPPGDDASNASDANSV